MKIHTKLNDDPAVHYTMGGTWVDYNLQTTIPGCFSGESNFSDHGANRLGASALMQGLWLFCSSLYYRRLFITRHKNGTYIY
jgi:aspartate oxidase